MSRELNMGIREEAATGSQGENGVGYLNHLDPRNNLCIIGKTNMYEEVGGDKICPT